MTADEWLADIQPEQKAASFDKLICAYYDHGHQAAYLALDHMFESSGLLLPWQRGTRARYRCTNCGVEHSDLMGHKCPTISYARDGWG